MSKQSSVEWLIDQIDFDANTRWFSQPEWFAIFEKVKAMHKEEITSAHLCGQNSNEDIEDQQTEIEYYNETFGDEEVL